MIRVLALSLVLVLVGGGSALACDKTPPPPEKVHQVVVSWQGPCGDPMHGVVVRNKGDYAETVRFHFRQFGAGWVTKVYTVAPHASRWSGWKHVLGHTLMTVRWRGSVLDSRLSAAPGSYGTCVR